MRGCGGIDDLFVGRALLPVGDVVCDGALKQPGVLQDHAEGATYLVAGQLGVVGAVQADAAGVDLIEAYEQVDQGGLACAGRADDRDALAGGHVEGEVFDEGLVWLVPEGHVLQAHLPGQRRGRGWGSGRDVVSALLRRVQELENPLCGGQA
jgi:hypothetical protein